MKYFMERMLNLQCAWDRPGEPQWQLLHQKKNNKQVTFKKNLEEEKEIDNTIINEYNSRTSNILVTDDNIDIYNECDILYKNINSALKAISIFKKDDRKNANLGDWSKIIDKFDKEIYSFIQVCPKEMINKLENPITDKINIKEVS